MRQVQDDVEEFMDACEQDLPDSPVLPDELIRLLRRKLLREEFNEYEEAEEKDDLVEIADALADIMYIAVGTASAYGIDLEPVWREVQRSNLDKIDPKTGKVTRRADGKVLKPEGWVGPDVKGVLEKQGM